MAVWTKLIALDASRHLPADMVSRLAQTAGHAEPLVDLLVRESMTPDVAFALFVSSGHKVGRCAASVPRTRLPIGCQRALRVEWLSTPGLTPCSRTVTWRGCTAAGEGCHGRYLYPVDGAERRAQAPARLGLGRTRLAAATSREVTPGW